MRLPKIKKEYLTSQLQVFADRFDPKQIIGVQYGKQDIRGTESITLIDKKNCIPYQLSFENKWELLGFIRGYNEGQDKSINQTRFRKYQK